MPQWIEPTLIGDRCYVTARQAATLLGVGKSRVTVLIRDGSLAGIRVGTSMLIDWDSYKAYRDHIETDPAYLRRRRTLEEGPAWDWDDLNMSDGETARLPYEMPYDLRRALGRLENEKDRRWKASTPLTNVEQSILRLARKRGLNLPPR